MRLFSAFCYHRLRKFIHPYRKMYVIDVGSGIDGVKDLWFSFPNALHLSVDYNPKVFPTYVRDIRHNNWYKGICQQKVVIARNILEHVENPTKTAIQMSRLVKQGGYLYLEFPNKRMMTKRWFANQFADDDTHVAFPGTEEITNALIKNGFIIVDGGVRRDWRRVLMLKPWDILGLSDFILARKVK